VLVDQLRDVVLTASEKRVAEVMIRQPEIMAFGTVAELAAAAATGGATVMRLATKLGFQGFRELQDTAQSELTRKLRPAAVRARLASDDDPVERAIIVELRNVQASLDAIDRSVLTTAAATLNRARRVVIVSSDAANGVAADFAAQLSMVRPDVLHATGGSAGLVRSIAWLDESDVLVAIDIARYEAAVNDVVSQAALTKTTVISLVDSPLSPIARHSDHVFIIAAEGPGPFDSLTGALAVSNVLVAAAVVDRGEAATAHLDRLEATWSALGVLTDD
jgi:DNA-binding MurR/RpiR family transcriptional regulator